MIWGGHVRFHLVVSAIFALSLNCTAFGCTCVAPPPSIKAARDLAEWTASRSEAIFEGRVERVELKWAFREANVGDVIPTDIEQNPPVMLISFDVSRSYRGGPGKRVRIRTGLGGGDCGFHFEVYASAGDSGQLSTGICSGTALLEESQANLSYLRGEPIVPQSLERHTPLEGGKLCDRVVGDDLGFADSQVLLLRVGDKSLVPSDEAEPATGVIPGKYHLVFVNRAENSPTSFVFFPGVAKSSGAMAIEVKDGQANSELLFDVPHQPTFSINGTVLASPKATLPTECKVALLSADYLSFALAYTQEVAPNDWPVASTRQETKE